MSSVQLDSGDGGQTRKQRREQARAERRALEQAHAAGAARRARLLQLAAVVVVVLVGIAIVLLSSGGGRKVPPATGGGAKAIDAEVSTLLAGIPQNGNLLGRPAAPVTLQYYGDLECPFCQQFTLDALPTLIGKWVRAGKLRVEYHSIETATREPEVFKTQQIAALAAGKQQKLWNFIETFYHEQGEEDSGYVTEKFIQGIAQQVPGLNLAKWSGDRNDAELSSQLLSDAQSANAAGVSGTPTLLLGVSGGAAKKLEPSSFTSATPFNEAIEKLLAS